MKYVTDTREVIKIIKKAFREKKDLKIYYPKTENNEEGWRTVTPVSLSTDIPPEGEVLVFDKEAISPGHILNARNKEKEARSFIVGKIKFIKCI